MVDAVAPPTLLVDEHGRLVQANAAAEALIRRGDGLRFVRGRVTTACGSSAGALEAAIAQVLAPDRSQATAIAVPCPGGGRLWLSLMGVAADGQPRRALITIAADSADLTLVPRLRDLFGLTPGEAVIAVRLSEGAELSAIADERRVALSTVRSQVKAIAAKLGCSRQSEIVAMVHRLPPLRQA